MISEDAVLREAVAERRVASVPLSHLSIELGHLYMDDFKAGPGLQQHFEQVVPWANAGREACAESLQSDKGHHGQHGRAARPRISTCFLVDDYFTRFSSPAELVPKLVSAARAAGLEIDYLARESGCVEADGVPLARLVEGRLAVDLDQRPESNGRKTWSCPFLAAVWQLLRLGIFCYDGKSVVVARQWEGEFPDDWKKMPPVTQLNPTATPFSAYRTLSILSTRFLSVEHAVRKILSQVVIDYDVLGEMVKCGREEGVSLPLELVDRIGYVFADFGIGRQRRSEDTSSLPGVQLTGDEDLS